MMRTTIRDIIGEHWQMERIYDAHFYYLWVASAPERCGSTWLAVEHDERWADRVQVSKRYIQVTIFGARHLR